MQKTLNPNYPSKGELGSAVSYSLYLYLNGNSPIDGGYIDDGEDGYLTGTLDQDIGQFKAGDRVILFYNGDNVMITSFDPNYLSEDYDLDSIHSIYRFRVALEKPLIIEGKARYN